MIDLNPLYDGILGSIQRECLDASVPIISPDAARFISVVLSVLKPESALEIGCAHGFSAGLICRYIKEGGYLTTIDRFDIMIRQAKINFERLGITEKLTLLEGQAADILPALKGNKFDFILLDAAKGQYLSFLPYCLEYLKVGGILVADDVLQDGRIEMERHEIPRRQRTIHSRMRKFIYELNNTENLRTAILDISGGLAFCCKTGEINIKREADDE